MTRSVMPHTVRSAFEKVLATCRDADAEVDIALDAVWYAEARAGAAAMGGGAADADACLTGIEAVAIDSRERMRSSGYVVPGEDQCVKRSTVNSIPRA